MYSFVLAVHNIFRWIVLIFLFLAIVRAYWGWFSKREWTQSDRRVGTIYSVSIDIQLMLGIVLLIIITNFSFASFSAVFANAERSSFAVEHLVTMLVAVILAHISVVSVRRANEDVAKHRRAAFWFSLSLVVIILGMPWFRPLLPVFGG